MGLKTKPMSILFILVLAAFCIHATAFSHSGEWFRVEDFEGVQIGTQSNDVIVELAVDDDGSIYIAVNVNAGADKNKQSSFLKKYDPYGSLSWSRMIAGKKVNAVTDVLIGKDGFIYVTGSTKEDLYGKNEGGGDVFLAKYSPDGQLVEDFDGPGRKVWPKQFGSKDGDSGSKLVMDDSGNLYLAGFTQGALFKKENRIIRKILGPDQIKIFVAKFGPDGKMQRCSKQDGCFWPVMLDFGLDNMIYDMALGDDGIYFTGWAYSPQSRFFGVDHSKIEYSSFIVGRLDTNGELKWVNERGRTSSNLGCGIDVASDGSVIVVGTTYKKFQEGPIKDLGKMEDMNFSFVSRYDDQGGLIWTQYSPSIPRMENFDVAIDRKDGSIYVLSSITHDEVVTPVLLKYDQKGSILGRKNFRGGYLLSWPKSLKIHGHDAYIVGRTNGKFFEDFFGLWDGFLIKSDLSF